MMPLAAAAPARKLLRGTGGLGWGLAFAGSVIVISWVG
jgi:hypothetical protein